jgi:chromosome segregation ATPase
MSDFQFGTYDPSAQNDVWEGGEPVLSSIELVLAEREAVHRESLNEMMGTCSAMVYRAHQQVAAVEHEASGLRESLGAENAALRKSLAEAEGSLDKALAEAATLERQLGEENAAFRKSLAEAEGSLNKALAEVATLERQLGEVKTIAWPPPEALTQANEALRRAAAAQAAMEKANRADLSRFAAECAEMKRERAAHATELRKLRVELESETAMANNISTENKRLTKIGAKLTSENTEMVHKINELNARVGQLDAETSGFKCSMEQMLRNNQVLGAEFLSVVILRPAIHALHTYMDNKMMALRDAPDDKEVKNLLHEYFNSNEMAAFVDARVQEARKGVPYSMTEGVMPAVLSELTRRGG